MVEEGVDQGSVRYARPRVHGHSGGLVHDDQEGVLEQDGQGDVLGLGDGRRRGRDRHPVGAGPCAARGIRHRGAVPADRTRLHQGPQTRPGELRKGVRKRPVQPPRRSGGERRLQDLGPGRRRHVLLVVFLRFTGWVIRA